MQLYEVKSAASKGLGVFAIRSIARGTRILAERPLFNCRNNFSDVLVAFCKSSVEDQGKFLALSGHMTEDWRARQEKQLCGSPESDPEAAELPVKQQVSILDKFYTNCYNINTDNHCAIFDDACRINHSCLPNVQHCWNERLGRLIMHAIRDI